MQVYQAKLAAGGKRKIRLYNVVFIVLYIIQTTIVLSSIGEPYRKFLEKADQEGFQGTHCEAKRDFPPSQCV